MPRLTVAEIAELCGGEAQGDLSREIASANTLEEATDAQLSFAATRKAAAMVEQSKAGCLLVPLGFDCPPNRTIIRVKDPRVAFARIIRILYPQDSPGGIHPTANIASSATIDRDCFVGPNVTISENTRVGSRCIVHAGCFLGDDVILGDCCILHPNVTIYKGVRIGCRVILHAGCVIGADGFGFAFTGENYEKFPQIGTVQIEDDVEIGANSCVDRAALGVTRIGQGTKIDNLVHVGHNCEIGKHVVIAAQTGFSGGVKVGDFAVVGGQVGIGDKATIESKSVVGSGSGILTSKIVRAGDPVWGTPARPLKQYLEQLASLGKLPRALEELKELKRRVDRLEKS
ncbi:MAG: UDP-3-O-(3-hydroxymyristoyl)glucosamine N-acyltransferase [Bryobacteraceae bacterium]